MTNIIFDFKLGKISKIDSLEVLWPDGKKNVSYSVEVNQLVEITYKNSILKSSSSAEKQESIFVDITEKAFKGMVVSQIENSYDDFRDQILLPHKLSTEGPCISVADVNNDGFEDFFIGGATGETGRIFLQMSNKTFEESKQGYLLKDKGYEDVDAVFFDANSDGFPDLYVVSGGNEFKEGSMAYQDRLYLNNGKGQFSKTSNLPRINSSGGCVLPLDFDSDGDLDLFIGARLVPKKYPKSPKSYLLENTNGVFKDVIKMIAPELEYIGLVTDAVFEDIDLDTKKELIVVGEWMPITLFKKTGNRYNKKEPVELAKSDGWWNCITPTDIDNDGDIDFIVGNLGTNYKFKASAEKPFYVFASDYDQNGTNDIFLAKKYKNKIVPVRGKECSTQQLPSLSKKFKSYGQFAKADINDVLGVSNEPVIDYKAYQFNSVVLKNEKGKLVMKPLPYQAQYSTVQSIVSDDFTGNGIHDILIAGNKFNVEIETTRADASVGVLLEGSSTGVFNTKSVKESGVFLPGNVKTLKTIRIGEVGNGEKFGVLVGVNDAHICLLVESSVSK